MTPFTNFIIAFFISPLMATSCQFRVVIVHSYKRVTWSRESIRSTAEVYWTTASPLELAAVVMWNVRPGIFFLQRNLIRVKGMTFLSSFMAVVVRKTCLLLISRYEVFTGRRDGWVELFNTSLEMRSQPPEITQGSFVMSANKPATPKLRPAPYEIRRRTFWKSKLIGLYQILNKSYKEFRKFSSKITYLHSFTNCDIEVFENFV